MSRVVYSGSAHSLKEDRIHDYVWRADPLNFEPQRMREQEGILVVRSRRMRNTITLHANPGKYFSICKNNIVV